MYNAMAAFQTVGGKGSTRLHMDMSDALNIMTFASSTPDGNPGTAAWDLFRAEDSTKLRHFLKKKFRSNLPLHDPIHSQQFYLDTKSLAELWKDYGVKSFRIYQKPGEAIFIPAGCAHQVSLVFIMRNESSDGSTRSPIWLIASRLPLISLVQRISRAART